MNHLDLHEVITLVSICPMPMLLLDTNGQIRTCNRAFAGLVGISPEQLTAAGQPDELILPLLGDSDVVHWITMEGDECWLAIKCFELVDTPGAAVRFYVDITEQLNLRRERDALADQLRETTLRDQEFPGMLSRHGIKTALESMVSRCRRYNTPLSVVVLGIRVDPDSGLDTGRRHMATLLRDQTRWADLVGCSDARDFLLILQETGRDAAMRLVDKLEMHIERMNSGSALRIAAYYGITDCHKNDDADTLLERAEEALQEAYCNDNGRSVAM